MDAVPREDLAGLGEEVEVGVLVGAIGVGLGVLGETGLAAFGGQARQVLDAERRPDPEFAGNRGWDGHEVETLVREDVARFPGEEATNPEPGAGVVSGIAPHREDLEGVGASRQRLRIDETAERGAVGGVESLVGVEGEEPVRLQSGSRLQEPVAVGSVVPIAVVRARRVGQQNLDEGFGLKECPRLVRRTVVEGNDRIAKGPDGREVPGEIAGAVADGEEEDETSGHLAFPDRARRLFDGGEDT